MKQLLWLIIFQVLIGACNSIPEKILPDWKEGDTKLIIYNYDGQILKNDSIVDFNVNKKHNVRVVENQDNFYILEFTNKSKIDISFLSESDTIYNDDTKFFELLSRLPQFDVPFEVKFSKEGKPIEIIDWEIVIGDFIIRLLDIADSVDFNKYSNKYIETQARSAFEVEDRLKIALLQEISEVFEVYGSLIPKDSTMVEYNQVSNPENGKLVDVMNTTRLHNFEKNIVELSFSLDFDENQIINNDEDNIDDIFDTETKKSDIEMTHDKKLYWDVKSTWPVKIDETESLKKGDTLVYIFNTKIEVIDK